MIKKALIILWFFAIHFTSLNGQSISFEEMMHKADVLRAESKYDSALSILRNLNQLANDANDIHYVIRSNTGIGSVLFMLKQWPLARSYYSESLRLASVIGDKSEGNRALHGIGSTFQQEGALDSALYYYRSTLQQYQEDKNFKSLAAMLTNLASINFQKGELDLAIENTLKSSEYAELADYPQLIGSNQRLLGLIYRTKKSYDSAQEFYFEAYRIAKSHSFLNDKGEALKSLVELKKEMGDLEMANKYLGNYIEVVREIYVKGENDEILDLREKYNTASLELENERQKNIAEQQRKSKFIILVVAVALIMIISVWLYIIDQRRKNMKLLAEKNEEINKQQIDELLQEQEIASLQGVLQGQESERKRVAMDLHDRLGGMLSMVKLHFSAFEERIDASDVKNQKFLKASELLDQATKEVREISHDLLSGVLTKFGLIPALEELKDKISSTGKLKVGIYSNDIKGALNAEQELQLYRIVQELLSNILKHAKAKETNIQLNRSGDSLNLIVEDDGVGFNLSNSNEKGGIGLINLKARVAKLNGSFHIDSGKGGGTTISIDIPLNND